MSEKTAEKLGLSPCADLLRRHDRERYLACLFAPPAHREALFALYAFNLEVAKTAEVVSEPMLGHIRLQWWRESLEGIYEGRARQHEVVQPLAAAIERYGLARGHFDALIDAREADLDPEPLDDLAALERYAQATGAGLLRIALQVVCGKRGPSAAALETADRWGSAVALVGLMRAVPFHARQKRLYLPRDLMAAERLDQSELFELRGSDALSAIVRSVVERAGALLGKPGEGRPDKAARPALLPAALARGHIKRLRAAGYDPFALPPEPPRLGTLWRLLLASAGGRF